MQATVGVPVVESSSLSECLDRLAAGKERTRPLATYRLQFHRGFRFEDARRLVPYLHALGVSHCYASPLLKARAGSTHGYDIVDHNQLNPEIGSEEELRRLDTDLKTLGMGIIVDLVPNHMGVGHGSNPWWQDVLENGRASRFAEFFDIDWQPFKPELHGKVLLPVLGAEYGKELENGKLTLHYESGRFYCLYYDRRLPIDPQTAPMILETLSDTPARGGVNGSAGNGESATAELQVIIAELRNLPRHDTSDPEEKELRQREIPRLCWRLARLTEQSVVARQAIEAAVERCNGRAGDRRSFDCLHRLLDAQAYRLAHWRVSGEEINYRRFFDINDLVALRMENPETFAATHQLIRRLLADGVIEGLRIDHPDGLYNPIQYFTRLQMLYAAARCSGAEARGPVGENGIETSVQVAFGQHDWIAQRPPLYVLIEKILQPGERLPQGWPVGGTVGYEFANLLNNVFIDVRSQQAFTNLYHRFLEGVVDVSWVIYNCKRLIMRSSLASEITVLGHMLDEISSTDRHARDFTRSALTDVIRETIACFPVYRTYIDQRGHISESDRRSIEQAVTLAKRRNETRAANIFDFLRDILLLKSGDGPMSVENSQRRLHFTLKFQQLTGPVMAKGLEDTACYVYNRFVSVNDVGGSPAQFGIPVEEFHRANQQRAKDWPAAMLCTSTHDSKRSEDVRARLNVLSEIPREWSSQVMRWRRSNRGKKRALPDGRPVPDANEEYLLYQVLVGAWPFEMDDRAREEFIRRIQGYMTKAVHEAKVNLSWTNPNPQYIEALEGFIADILQPAPSQHTNYFLKYLHDLLPRVAYFGAINSLAQVLLKLTSPGVPDIYQGCELWDLSLVDPDNRRPVEYGLRQAMMDELMRSEGDRAALCRDLWRTYPDGRIKMWTTMQTLRFRREHADLFAHGSYAPLNAIGDKPQHVIGLAREHEGRMVLAIVPRLACTLLRGQVEANFASAWNGTQIELPSQAPPEFVDVFTGKAVRATPARTLLCRELFAHFPVVLLST